MLDPQDVYCSAECRSGGPIEGKPGMAPPASIASKPSIWVLLKEGYAARFRCDIAGLKEVGED